MADFEEMRNAVTRAVMHTVQCRWCIPGYGVYCSEHARIANEDEQKHRDKERTQSGATDDIVTRLREIALEERPLWRSPMIEAADEIERLREWNTEIRKLLEQAQVCWDIFQKSEDELIAYHHGKCVELLEQQGIEIERLRLENLELRSEIQRLTQQAHYAG